MIHKSSVIILHVFFTDDVIIMTDLDPYKECVLLVQTYV